MSAREVAPARGMGGRSSRARALPALLLAAAGALLGGCGFHLEGRAPLPKPLAVTFVEAVDPQTDFVQGLRRALITSGGQLADSSTEASGTVRILTDEVTRRILSVSANNTPREYELTYTVKFSVSSGDQELLPAQQVAVTRDFSFDERALLAKENEEAILREGMARDLVAIVMRRLASLRTDGT